MADRGALLPRLLARRQPPRLPPPVGHARLRQREREEDADRVERDEAGDARVEDPDQERGHEGEDRDPPREDEAAAAVGELPGQVPVRRLQRGQPGKAGVGGVRGHGEDQRRRPDRGEVERPPPVEGRAGDLRDHRLVLGGHGADPAGEEADRRGTGQPRIPDIQSSVIPALRLRGSLNAGMPFEIASTPVSAVVPLENAWRIEEEADRPDRLDVERRRVGHRVQCAEQVPDDRRAHGEPHHRHEEERGHREHESPTPSPPAG